jgi:hypothetical protein
MLYLTSFQFGHERPELIFLVLYAQRSFMYRLTYEIRAFSLEESGWKEI